MVGVLGSLGVDLAKIPVENIYDTLKNLDNTDDSYSNFAGKYREGLVIRRLKNIKFQNLLPVMIRSTRVNTVIKYVAGDGDDVILSIEENDTLQITGSTYTTMKSGSDVVFKVGSGSITVRNGVNVGFNVDFKSSNGSNSRTLDLLYDNNFITNELQIDDISEVTETNLKFLRKIPVAITSIFFFNSVREQKDSNCVF